MTDHHLPEDPPEIEDVGSNPSPGRLLGDIIAADLSRRAALAGCRVP